MAAKDYTEGNPESLFGIGYATVGRNFIFIISFVLILSTYGDSIARLTICGEIMQSIILNILSMSSNDIHN